MDAKHNARTRGDCKQFQQLAKDYLTKQQFSEGIELLQKAIDIDKKPIDASRKIFYIRHLNMTTAHRLRGDTKTALEHLKLAREYALHNFAASSFYIAVRCGEKEGLLYTQDGDLPMAKSAFDRALQAAIKIDPSNVLLHYRTAVVSLRQGEFQLAMGEVARVANVLADSLELKQRVNSNIPGESETIQEEIKSLRLFANSIRREIQGAEYDQYPDTQDTYDLLITSHYR
ncbi:hypothetical protein B7494_g3020 [Chlorociboria aeruginascens]|nr:hypothetical protein B7494_g3020 [Chlorociboria aeruginascens]